MITLLGFSGLLLFPNYELLAFNMPTENVVQEEVFDSSGVDLRSIEEYQIEWLYTQKIIWRAGCEGQSPCRKNAYDCSGIIGASFREIGCYQGAKPNSTLLSKMGEEVNYKDAKIGDIVYFQRVRGEGMNHVAIVTRGWNGTDYKIGDFYGNGGHFSERKLGVRSSSYLSFKLKVVRQDCSSNHYTHMQLASRLRRS